MGFDLLAHFETGAYRRNNTFLGDEEYGRALDCFVKGCADVLMQDESTGELLIMRRIVHPQPDWWFVGGRMRAGDTPEAAAQKNVLRETGLRLPLDRFTPVCTTSMLWQKRKQEPEDNGTADIAVVFLVRLTESERAAIKADSEEYDEMAWVAPEAVAGGDGYHPALRRAAQHVLAHAAYLRLDAAAGAGEDDATVAAAARAYVSAQATAKQLGTVPVPFKQLRAAPSAAQNA